jgi:hypothetical protein
MSTDGDVAVVQNSLNDNLEDATSVFFSDKNYAFITDSTSNSGSFSSGQIQFDLSTLNSQSQWINLNEAVIEFPVKMTAVVTTAGTGTETAKSIAAISTSVIKNGWHQWIDSAQLIINGQTIQSSQPYENVAASFRILSSWSQDTLKKWGASCGVALDDCTGDLTTSVSSTIGIANSTYGGLTSSICSSVKGFDVINNQTYLLNKGVVARNTFTNNDISPASASIQTTILGASSMKTAGRSHVASTAAGSNTANTSIYSAYYMATVRLRDLADINDFPLVKNLKGFLYLSFNSSQVNLTGTAGSTTISAMSVTPLTGRTTPFLINNQSSGLVLGNYATSAPVVQVTGSVDATTTNAVGSAGPLLTNARLLVPYYVANPKTDQALTNPNKFFTTYEKIVNPMTIAAGGSINYTITTGVPNPRKLMLLPMWQNLGGVSNLSNPEVSPFDSVPATSGPFAGLNNLQVYLANKAIYQYPIQYDYEQWVSENAQVGLNGGLVSEDTSGLLTQQLFEQNHRFYVVDLSRRMTSEDGSSKSVQVSFTNPSSSFGMKVIAIVWYEKQWVIDTAMCQLQTL